MTQTSSTISVLVVEDHQPMREEFARMVQVDAGLSPVSYTHLTLPTIYSV